MVSFNLNGNQHTLQDGSSDLSLAQYIREVALLTGTKISCNEGGCGACIVTVNKEGKSRSVNSCLTPVNICDGWEITTVEGLGGKDKGYHPIQTAVSETGGTQCGYCSPGMVMQLHAYLQEHPQATKMEIDNILDGNICRCTGYRPILDALKQFASDSPNKIDHLIQDIEDIKLCHKTGERCNNICGNAGNCKQPKSSNWHQPTTLDELTQILNGFTAETKYRIVGGNTGTGVFKRDEESYDAFININKIPELKAESTSPMFLGGNVSITDAIAFFAKAGQTDPVWTAISQHLKLIASVGIRNQGTLAGNLMMKNAHNDFPSDVYISMATVGAMLEIVDHSGASTMVPVVQFVTTDMNRKFIKSIQFSATKHLKSKAPFALNIGARGRMIMPPHHMPNNNRNKTKASKTFIRTFKIMPRSSNAHAYVNAGFMAEVDEANNFQLIGKPTLVFGGISATFTHATQTENFLMDRNMNDNAVFQQAVQILQGELEPEYDPVLASPEYRKQLALGLFYKFFLHVLGTSASQEVQSGAANIERGLSSGQQSYDTDESMYPVSQPIEKVEGKWQTSGEIKFTGDAPFKQGELHAAFVLSSRANCDMVSMDATDALAMPGVVEFVDANDIPGVNTWKNYGAVEEVFSSGKINYAGQSIGLIVAETRDIAIEAARKVKVVHENEREVNCDLEKALENPDNIVSGGYTLAYGDVTGAINGADHVVQGRFKMGSQYHFHMETQTCIATPMEDGFDIEIASQDITSTQHQVAQVMNIDDNSINITVKRLGGAYGAKIVLPMHLATAATVAANKVKRPVRLWLNLEDNMKMLGKRNPYLFDYKIGLSAEGKILGVESSIYCDSGWSLNEVDSMMAAMFGQNCYKIPNCKYIPYGVKTDTAPPTAVRAPGMVNGAAMMEAIMEHAAAEIGMKSLDLRMKNLMETGDPIMPPPLTLPDNNPIAGLVEEIQASSDYASRVAAIQDFNSSNKWKKRGISLVPMRYGHNLSLFSGLKMNCVVSIYGGDGSVAVAHNGIEMGQGINTKVAQSVAYELGIDLSLVKIKPVTMVTNPNGATTGGSCGSETNQVAAIKCCEILKERLQPIRDELGAGATWQEIIAEANGKDIDLCARYMFEAKKDNYPGYSVWGVSVIEVEVDVLTGENYVVRADIVQDAGLSTAPIVDIGQVEGAYIMGLGLWTSEEIKHDPTTGEMLTKNTWEYKPPAAKDIPQDFRVNLHKNDRNPLGVYSSKATGEPSLLMSIGVLFAIRDALNSSRSDAGLSGWWQLNGPATVEQVNLHAGVTTDQFTF